MFFWLWAWAPHKPVWWIAFVTARPLTLVHFERLPLSKPSVKRYVVADSELLTTDSFPAASSALTVYDEAVAAGAVASVNVVTFPSVAIAGVAPLR